MRATSKWTLRRGTSAPIAPVLWLLAVGAVPAIAACEDKKPSETARTDGGAAADKNAMADPKLEKAIQAAAAASAAATSGPPPDGIFPPGAADQRHAKGAPTTLEILSEGSDPKISLAPTADASADAARASSYGPAMLEVAIEMGRGMPTPPVIDFGMLIGPAKKEDGGSDWLVAEVKKAQAAQQQLGQLPAGIDKEIATFEGSLLRVKATPDGRESDVNTQLAKSADPGLDLIAQIGTETIALDTVPLPGKPVGVGAQWIAESRMPLQGVDTVVYRAFRVAGIDGDRVHLTLEVNAYAATRDVQVSGVQLPKGATLDQFATEAQAKLDLVRGESLARTSDLQERLVLVFAGPGGKQPPQQPGGQPGNIMPVQRVTQATFVRGDDMRTMTAAGGGHGQGGGPRPH